ncbi:MAG: hypothetical protein ACKO9Z_07390 [Planctomycetota bacterium]
MAIYATGRVGLMLAPKFHPWLASGAGVLVVLALIRAFFLARQAGYLSKKNLRANQTNQSCESKAHHHGDHAHDECGHSHHHPDASAETCCDDHHHGPDCGHDHGHQWLPLQVMVLSIPIVLFALNLPNEAFGAMKALDLEAYSLAPSGASSGGKADGVSFLQLERAASNPEARGLYDGKTVQLVGKFVGDHDKRFTLIRYKMNCCAADAVPLNAAIMVDPQSQARLDYRHWSGKWVEVNGEVRFLQSRDGKSYLAALILRAKDTEELNKSETWIRETVPDSPFLTN